MKILIFTTTKKYTLNKKDYITKYCFLILKTLKKWLILHKSIDTSHNILLN